MRPPLPRELTGYRPYENAVLVDGSQKVVTLSENLQSIANNGVVDGLVRWLRLARAAGWGGVAQRGICPLQVPQF